MMDISSLRNKLDHEKIRKIMEDNEDLQKLLLPRLTKYIPHKPYPTQQAFLWLKCLEAFYGGAAGGGKSDAVLMAALQYVDFPGYNAVIIRNSFANLSKPEGLIPRSHEWLAHTDAHWSGIHKRWFFPTQSNKVSLTSFGEVLPLPATLSFGHMDGPMAHFEYQSAAYQYVAFDELVQIPENQAIYLFSRLRQLEDLPVPLRWRGASNPPAREQIATGAWVKKRYGIDKTSSRFGKVYKGRVFIPAKLKDNLSLNHESYIKSLMELDPVTRKQLLDGDWEVKVEGNMFKLEWFEKQIISRSMLPTDRKIVRAWDFAASEKLSSAFTAGVKMSRTPDGIYYIEDVKRFQGTPGKVRRLIRATAESDGIGVMISIPQDPGQAGKDQVYSYYKLLDGFSLRHSPESGSKVERASAFSSQCEIGNVFLVDGPWIEDYLNEAVLFPDGEFLDQIDATSRGYHFLAKDVKQQKIGKPAIVSNKNFIQIDKQNYGVKISDGFKLGVA
jgi:predicted phage terminase large subunit-like protein